MPIKTQEYIARLRAVGMRLDDATMLINDFMREQDWDGLVEFVIRIERLHGLAVSE